MRRCRVLRPIQGCETFEVIIIEKVSSSMPRVFGLSETGEIWWSSAKPSSVLSCFSATKEMQLSESLNLSDMNRGTFSWRSSTALSRSWGSLEDRSNHFYPMTKMNYAFTHHHPSFFSSSFSKVDTSTKLLTPFQKGSFFEFIH